MKTLKLLFAVFALSLTLCVNAQNSKKHKKIIIIDGYFFREMPVSVNDLKGGYGINTPTGTKAIGIEISGKLPKKALKYAVPEDSIPEHELLLQMFEETKAKTATIATAPKTAPLLKEGNAFPDFTETDINGRTWTNADVKGKVMVLNLWFTGCGPCRAEMPELSTWKDEMPDVMFFSSTYEKAERARPVIEDKKFSWIPLVNDKHFHKFIGTGGYPMTIVVDKNGIIAKVEQGTSPVQREELKNKIMSLR